MRPPYESLAQVALRFALIPRGVSTIIPGARNAAQVLRNTAVARLPDLEREIVERLRADYADFTPRANTG